MGFCCHGAIFGRAQEQIGHSAATELLLKSFHRRSRHLNTQLQVEDLQAVNLCQVFRHCAGEGRASFKVQYFEVAELGQLLNPEVSQLLAPRQV